MTLLDEARSLAKSQGPKCATGELLKTDIGPELAEALAAPSLQHAAISRALQARGVSLKPDQVARHRNRDCTCDPS